MAAQLQHKRGIFRTLIDNSFLLIAGTLLALCWANGALNWKGIPEHVPTLSAAIHRFYSISM